MIAGLTALASFTPLMNGILEVIKRVVPDKSTQQQLEYELKMYQLTSDFQNAMAQIQVNQAEATSESIFVAGWRPFVGWICGIAFAYHVILVPILLFIGNATGHIIPVPAFDQDLLTSVLFGMLGLGGFRTAEKLYKNYNEKEVEKKKVDARVDIIKSREVQPAVVRTKKRVGLDATFNGE